MALPRARRVSRCAWLLCFAITTLLHACLAFDSKSLPSPVSVAPDQNWEGIDGKWNTFSLRIGTPYQPVRVFVSTASQQTWAVDKLACLYDDTDEATNTTVQKQDTDCYDGRGWTFNSSASSTWHANGFYQLWLGKNLGLLGNGQYGWDTVGLGLPGEEGPTLRNTTVGTIISSDFWLGHFGVNPKPTNFTNFTDPSPSYMTLLFEQNHIPSLSFGYTAGAQYRGSAVLASLTLGGYDSSRFVENDITWTFAPDNERDIVVGIVGIVGSSSTKSDINLLNREPFPMYIDSTIAELWLPVEVCQAFEDAFGLQYDNGTGLYLVDDQLHDRLIAENPSVTFLLGQKYSTNSTVNITLPYNAFDLRASPPYKNLENATNYFPIRRATRQDQYVLGRTFLQEAYLTVDWERQNFSVSACNWNSVEGKSIVPILSPQYTGERDEAGHLSKGAIIGIALGAGFGLLIMAVCVFFWCYRRRRQKQQQRTEEEHAAQAAVTAKKSSSERLEEPPNSPKKDSDEGNVFPKAELPADVKHPLLGVGAGRKAEDADYPTTLGMPSPLVEAENTERLIFEMEGDTPDPAEAGGRQLSEKETMMVRERRYNGVDPNGTPDVSPESEEGPRRLAPVSPSEVAMVNRRLPVSPITPLVPRPRDGASLEANDTFFQPLPRRTPHEGRSREAEETLVCPVSPLDGSTARTQRRFSYES